MNIENGKDGAKTEVDPVLELIGLCIMDLVEPLIKEVEVKAQEQANKRKIRRLAKKAAFRTITGNQG